MKPVPDEAISLLAAYPPAVQQIALRVRQMVIDVAPDVLEQVDFAAHMLAYGFAATYAGTLCVIILQKNYVNFGFPRGATLPDPAKLLQGTGKRARHVKLLTLEDVDSPALRALLEVSLSTR